ncbi:MAG: phosphoribosylglycinamide formyltransferase [Thaumarchaeota archaeon]|nr:phosphoribosylglycinamide formyltransferase [Nitrososphaerota archaeon]
MTLLKVGVLVSGRGSNLEAILKAVGSGVIKGAEVSVVISNMPDARALGVARRYGVKAVGLPSEGVAREDYDGMLVEALRRHGVEPGKGLVLLAGYMKMLSKYFVELYQGRIMNIHPSLLPSFPGLNAQRQALEYGVKISGCTVHFVVPEVDAGPIILQKAVEIHRGDTEETLALRILRQEHRIYPQAVKLFVEGRLKVEGRRTVAAR